MKGYYKGDLVICVEGTGIVIDTYRSANNIYCAYVNFWGDPENVSRAVKCEDLQLIRRGYGYPESMYENIPLAF